MNLACRRLRFIVKLTRSPLFNFHMSASMSVFVGESDRFKGITVTSGKEPCSIEQFSTKLKASLDQWTKEGYRGVWFLVGLSESEWVPVLAANGFTFHHARKPDRVAMVKWLPADEECQIPPYAHHMIGVGGMVVNDRDEILTIQGLYSVLSSYFKALKEKYNVQASWKLPGGYVDPGEDLPAAAVREIREETGVETEFQSIVAFRHAHGYNFGCSDIYVVVCLKPVEGRSGSDITVCEREISKAKWMPIKEFASDPDVLNTNRYFAERYLRAREKGLFIGRTMSELKLKTRSIPQQIYSVEVVGDEDNTRIIPDNTDF